MTHKWTKEEDQVIREMAASRHSASEISRHFYKEFGISTTRNAIIGRANRIKAKLCNNTKPKCPTKDSIVGKSKKIIAPGSMPRQQQSSRTGLIVPGTGVPGHSPHTGHWGSLRDGGPITFDELKTDTCRWPAELDERGIIKGYCGAKIPAGPYCLAHSLISAPPRKKEEKAA